MARMPQLELAYCVMKQADMLDDMREALIIEATEKCPHRPEDTVEVRETLSSRFGICQCCGYTEEKQADGYWKLTVTDATPLAPIDWWKLMTVRVDRSDMAALGRWGQPHRMFNLRWCIVR